MNRMVVLQAIPFALCFSTAHAQTLTAALKQLGMELAQDINSTDPRIAKVAVPEFLNGQGQLGGDIGGAGLFVADRVQQYLINAPGKRYEVVMRGELLTPVLKEWQLGESGLLKPETCKQIGGAIPGLDGLIVGRVTRFYWQLQVTATLVRIPDAIGVCSRSALLALDADTTAAEGGSVRVRRGDDDSLPTQGDLVEGARTYLPQKDDFLPYALEVLVDETPRRAVVHDGTAFVPLARGETYQLRLTNWTNEKVGVALFVDGLNVIDRARSFAGSLDAFQPAAQQLRNLPSESSMWVLDPKSRAVIKGWQVDGKRAAEFRLVAQEDSSAVRQHFTEQLGLITAVFYPQKGSQYQGFGGLRDATGLGNLIPFPVRLVEFEHEPVPSVILTIHYDTPEG